MNNRLKGFLALLICAVIFGLFSIFARWLNIDLLPYQQILFRNTFGLVIAVVFLFLWKGHDFRQTLSSIRSVSPKYLVAYTFTFPLSVVFFTLSVLQTKVITTIFGLYTGSLVTSLLIGLFVFKEKMTFTKIVCLVLVAAGLICFAFPFSTETLGTGLLFGIISGVIDTIANGFRKFLSGKLERIVLVDLQMMGGVLVAALLVVLFGQTNFGPVSINSWIIGAVWGICLIAISYLTLVGFQNFDLNLGTIVLSSELFFGSIFALIFFGEVSSLQEVLGGILIIAASALANTVVLDKLLRSTQK